MNEWDAVSNDTPTDSAPDIWEAVSTPERVTPPIRKASLEPSTLPEYRQEAAQPDETAAEEPASAEPAVSPDLAAAIERRRRRQEGELIEEEPQFIAPVKPEIDNLVTGERLKQAAAAPAQMPAAAEPEPEQSPALGLTARRNNTEAIRLTSREQQEPEEEIIETPRWQPKARAARPPTRRKPIFLYVLLAALLIVSIVGALVFKGFVSFPFLRLAPPAYPYLSSTYQGTGHNVTYNSTGNLTLSSVIENKQGNISGLVTWGSPLCGSGYFTGSLSTNDAIRFTNITADGSGCERLTIFMGTVNTENNSIGGSYTTGSKSQIGTWQVRAIKATTATAQAAATATEQIGATATVHTAATAIAQQQIYNQATSGTPAFNDPLIDDRNNWAVGSQPVGSCLFTGNAYHLIQFKANTSVFCTSGSVSTFNNFALQVQVSIGRGDRGGVVFDALQNTFYQVVIGSMGDYFLLLYTQSGQQSAILKSGFNTAIIKGLNQPNIMTVIVNRGNLYLYVLTFKLTRT